MGRPKNVRIPVQSVIPISSKGDHVSLNKGQKLVRILELMARRGGISHLELMERFDLDARTMRRYLADLRDLGIPLIDEGRGDDRLISVDARWRRTGVQLSLVEVLSLHFGRTLFNFLEGTSFASDLNDAIERLEPAIPRTHQDLCKQLDTKFLAVSEQSKDYRGDASEIIDEAITALVYNNPLEGRYRKANGMESAYRLHPYTLATFRQGLYLFAKDVDANLVKTFALERFTDLRRFRGERFEQPHGWRPEAHIGHAFGIISGVSSGCQRRLFRKCLRLHPRAHVAPYPDLSHLARWKTRATYASRGHH